MCNLFDIVRVEVLCFDGDGGSIDFNLNDVALRFVVKCWGTIGVHIHIGTYLLAVTRFFQFVDRWSLSICSVTLSNLLSHSVSII